MNFSKLRQNLIKLGYEDKSLRLHLRPILQGIDKKSGILQAPPKMVDSLTKIILAVLGHTIIDFNMMSPNWINIDPVKDRILELSMYAVRNTNPSLASRDDGVEVPVNMSGWGPIQDLNKAQINQAFNLLESITGVKKNHIKLSIQFLQRGKGLKFVDAGWDRSKGIIRLQFKIGESSYLRDSELDKLESTIKMAIRHELQHFAQYFLELATGTPTDFDAKGFLQQFYPSGYKPGMPPVGNPKWNQARGKLVQIDPYDLKYLHNLSKKEFEQLVQIRKEIKKDMESTGMSSSDYYMLDDKEFYTHLQDAVDSYKSHLAQVKSHEGVKVTPEFERLMIEDFIGVKDNIKALQEMKVLDNMAKVYYTNIDEWYAKSRRFFKVLKTHHQDKWKKAVSEFYKAV